LLNRGLSGYHGLQGVLVPERTASCALKHKHEEGGVGVTDLGQAERFRADVLAEPATLSALLYAYREPGSPLAALGEIRAGASSS